MGFALSVLPAGFLVWAQWHFPGKSPRGLISAGHCSAVGLGKAHLRFSSPHLHPGDSLGAELGLEMWFRDSKVYKNGSWSYCWPQDTSPCPFTILVLPLKDPGAGKKWESQGPGNFLSLEIGIFSIIFYLATWSRYKENIFRDKWRRSFAVVFLCLKTIMSGTKLMSNKF